MGLSEQNPTNHQEYKQGRCQLMNLFTLTFHFHALEKEMATHFTILAWENPWTQEPRGLQSMGHKSVRYN